MARSGVRTSGRKLVPGRVFMLRHCRHCAIRNTPRVRHVSVIQRFDERLALVCLWLGTQWKKVLNVSCCNASLHMSGRLTWSSTIAADCSLFVQNLDHVVCSVNTVVHYKLEQSYKHALLEVSSYPKTRHIGYEMTIFGCRVHHVYK